MSASPKPVRTVRARKIDHEVPGLRAFLTYRGPLPEGVTFVPSSFLAAQARKQRRQMLFVLPGWFAFYAFMTWLDASAGRSTRMWLIYGAILAVAVVIGQVGARVTRRRENGRNHLGLFLTRDLYVFQPPGSRSLRVVPRTAVSGLRVDPGPAPGTGIPALRAAAPQGWISLYTTFPYDLPPEDLNRLLVRWWAGDPLPVG